MNTWTRSAAPLLLALSVGTLFGCGGSGSSEGTGTLTLGVTDAPIDRCH